MNWRASGSVIVAGLLAVSSAWAQTTETKPKAEKDDTATVTVTGQKAQNKIDRQTYDNTKSIDTTATAADTLNKVPSVNVDSNGNVSLRGNSNVQILVDGKPSAMMSGDNRAAALQAMASGQIASVEVMNNPGAQYSSAGSAGIINLVTAKNRKPGGSGALSIAAGSDGRHNGSFNGTYRKGKVGWSGALGYRHDSRPGRRGSLIQRLDTNGQPTATTTADGTADNIIDSLNASGGLDYTIGDRDSLSAQLAYNRRDIDAGLDADYRDTGTTSQTYKRLTGFDATQSDTSAAVTWSHTGDSEGETLKGDLRFSRSSGANVFTNLTSFTSGPVSDRRDNSSDLKSAVLSVDYSRNLGNNQLVTGLQITHDDSDSRSHASGAGAGLTPDSAFAFDQTLSAAYVTLQHQFGARWTVLGGLRAESLDLDTRMVSSGTVGHVAYTKVNPSLFATYILSPAAKLRFSYSHRLQRPNPQDLNPFVRYVDPQNLMAGNAALKPEETDSFELGYERTAGTTSYQARLFYRTSDGLITNASSFAAPGIVLTTKGNLGAGEAVGTEFNINTKIGKKLSLNASGDLSNLTLTTPVVGERSAVSLNARLNLDYAATPKDRIQFSYTSQGTQLTGQGYRSTVANGSLAWRHTLTPKLSTLVSLADPFGTVKGRAVTETPGLYQVQTFSQRNRTLIFVLNWTLGPAK